MDSGEARAFIGLAGESAVTREQSAPGEFALISHVLESPIPADEVIVSWNADVPPGSGIRVEVRASCPDQWTDWYTLGLWSPDPSRFPRESVDGQKSASGDVHTDTLALLSPASRIQIRIGCCAARGDPRVRFVGISLARVGAPIVEREPNREAWGRELSVPGKSQLGWADGHGWCSPASTAMVLAFWARALKRPDLDVDVPTAARAIYDRVWKGTGNWPFNTAYAGSFAGIRAYVDRLMDVRELEDWVASGVPPVVSVSYDLLKGNPTAHDAGHLMVCTGFTRDGDIVLNDPCTHVNKGEPFRRVFARERFITAWANSKNTVYLIYPEGWKIPNDPLGHWASEGPGRRDT